MPFWQKYLQIRWMTRLCCPRLGKSRTSSTWRMMISRQKGTRKRTPQGGPPSKCLSIWMRIRSLKSGRSSTRFYRKSRSGIVSNLSRISDTSASTWCRCLSTRLPPWKSRRLQKSKPRFVQKRTKVRAFKLEEIKEFTKMSFSLLYSKPRLVNTWLRDVHLRSVIRVSISLSNGRSCIKWA